MPDTAVSHNLMEYAEALSGPANNSTCAKCGQRAPIILRGIHAQCTACGAKRMPFTAKALNLAGKGSRIGGAAARFFGWSAVIGGTSLSAFIVLLLQSFWPEGYYGYAFAIPIVMLSYAIGIPLVMGGRQLGRYAARKEQSTQLDAIRSMAAHRGGAVTVRQVAQTLSITDRQADDMLTELAKDPDGNVSLDLDDDGNIYYLFGLGGEELEAARWRIANLDLDASIAAETEAAAYEEARSAERFRR